ncbi:MAG: cation-translocating P-type ATPase [Clostridia bacterium]|nr:cation-translocating P-type ATPase [Clostridia bacterium]MBR1684614.1 cation-translocating P-type ATPase [Clostridia bacterium]MBR2288141.1 cation-translocating P-type ATPase [Clostridia bacterium]
MKSVIRSSLPGRLRLAVNGLSHLFAKRTEIAQAVCDLPGVHEVTLNSPTGTLLILYDMTLTDAHELQEETDLVLARYAMDATRSQHAQEKDSAELSMTTDRLARRLVFSALSAVLGNTVLRPTSTVGLARFTSPQAISSLILSAPIAKSAWEGLKSDHRPNADFLTVTSIVASLLLGAGNSALTILALSDLAELMTSYTIERTRNSIISMLSVDDSHVWHETASGRLERVAVSSLHPGDMVVIHTGEKIAVDGCIRSGDAVIDQSAITGEFVPVQKQTGDEVFAGTVVKSGVIHVEALKLGDDTVVSRIVGMVEESSLKRAPIQRYADRFSNYLVPLNFLLFGAVYLVTRDPVRALKMLVIDYSCGIKLSTATAFSAAINTGVRRGMLIKGGAFIEQMAAASTVLLDKTGTITEGKPEVTSVLPVQADCTPDDVLRLAMAAEETSTHPLAASILACGHRRRLSIPVHGEVITEVARGSRTDVDGSCIRVGNLLYMQESGVVIPASLPASDGGILTYVSRDSVLLGIISAQDRPRENVRRAINALRYTGVGDIELLTGDTESQARLVASQVGADGFQAQLLPEHKAEAVLKLQTHGQTVIMVGDGINDAPALAYADVGISLGSKSTDIAMETSDVVISTDDPMTVPELRRLARATMRIVHQNFALVISINTVGLILGAASNISVLGSAAMHNMSTILVVGNSLRLLFFSPEAHD